jgi:hypothetical protein
MYGSIQRRIFPEREGSERNGDIRKETNNWGLGSKVKTMLHVLKNGTKDIERFLERCTVKILCKHCYGFGCAHCQGYGFTREIMNRNRIYEV